MAEQFTLDRHEWYAGDDTTLRFVRNGSTPDPTGWALEFVVRKPVKTQGTGDVVALLTKTQADGIAVDGSAIVVTIDAADTVALDEQKVEATLRRTTSGAVTVLATGTAWITTAARRP